jgi:hypothetical protein
VHIPHYARIYAVRATKIALDHAGPTELPGASGLMKAPPS